jgi:hypothetical protein
MTRRILSIVLMLIAAVCLHARGAGERTDEEPQPFPPPSEYEDYFRGLTPEEQVMEYLDQSAEPFGQVAPLEAIVADMILMEETGLSAMPYFEREFARLEFEFCPGGSGTDLCNEAPLAVLGLVSSMTESGGQQGFRREVLQPSREDVEWFVEEARAEITGYIRTYRRMDESMIRAESCVLAMEDADSARSFVEMTLAQAARYLFDRYVQGDPDLEKMVGLPPNLVFHGFPGRVLEE